MIDTGTYSVEAAKAGHYNRSSTIYYINKLSVKAIALNTLDISLYPNPSSGKVFIKSDTDFVLEILDIAGRKIQDGSNLQFVSLPQGVYFFRFYINDNSYTEKVVVYER